MSKITPDVVVDMLEPRCVPKLLAVDDVLSLFAPALSVTAKEESHAWNGVRDEGPHFFHAYLQSRVQVHRRPRVTVGNARIARE